MNLLVYAESNRVKGFLAIKNFVYVWNRSATCVELFKFCVSDILSQIGSTSDTIGLFTKFVSSSKFINIFNQVEELAFGTEQISSFALSMNIALLLTRVTSNLPCELDLNALQYWSNLSTRSKFAIVFHVEWVRALGNHFQLIFFCEYNLSSSQIDREENFSLSMVSLSFHN